MNQNITSEELKVIRIDVQLALDEVAKKHDLASIKLGNIRYNATSFTSKIEALRVVPTASTLTAEGIPIEPPETALETSCWVVGIRDKGCTQKTYIVNGHPCKIIDVKFKNRSYPIIVEATDSSKSRYKLSVSQLEKLKVA